jgi:DNA-binding NtrC family response regulator
VNCSISATSACSPVSVVAIDDDGAFLEFLNEALAAINLLVYGATSGDEGVGIVGSKSPHLVLIDEHLPDARGLDLIGRVRHVTPGAEVIVVTADSSTELVVEAMKRGASDYLTKPLSLSTLYDKLIPLVERYRATPARAPGRRPAKESRFEGMISSSDAMQEVFLKIRRVGPHFHNALIEGETGTGKELVARALHQVGLGDRRPFVAFNCASIPDGLVESELFGYVKGAFTGALSDHEGLFQSANNGTVFLDEIGDMPLQQQARLLRVLQTRQVRRVGSSKYEPINVRLVAATHCKLEEMVREGKFREDLYYRLSSVEIFLPPLRNRTDDLPMLIEHFIERSARECGKSIQGVTEPALRMLHEYRWPGNIRELENVIEAACIVCDGNWIDVEHISRRVSRFVSEKPLAGSVEKASLKRVQLQHVLRTLDEVDGNKQKAARILGVSRAKLYRLIGEFENGDDGPSSGDLN